MTAHKFWNRWKTFSIWFKMCSTRNMPPCQLHHTRLKKFPDFSFSSHYHRFFHEHHSHYYHDQHHLKFLGFALFPVNRHLCLHPSTAFLSHAATSPPPLMSSSLPPPPPPLSSPSPPPPQSHQEHLSGKTVRGMVTRPVVMLVDKKFETFLNISTLVLPQQPWEIQEL